MRQVLHLCVVVMLGCSNEPALPTAVRSKSSEPAEPSKVQESKPTLNLPSSDPKSKPSASAAAQKQDETIATGDKKQPALPTATTLKKASELLDVRKISAPTGHRRHTNSLTSSNSMIPVDGKTNVTEVADFYRKVLQVAGWQELPGGISNENGAQAFYTKDGHFAQIVAGKSRSFPTGEEINAGIFLLGNIDARLLPKPTDATVAVANLNILQFTSKMSAVELWKFYRSAMRDLGWIDYRNSVEAIYGKTDPENPTSQYFFQNGVNLTLQFSKLETGARVSVSVSLLPEEVPVLEEAKGVSLHVMRNDSPFSIFYSSKRSPEEVVSFYTKYFAELGLLPKELKDLAEKVDRAVLFSAEGKQSYQLELQKDTRSTNVMIKHGPKK